MFKDKKNLLYGMDIFLLSVTLLCIVYGVIMISSAVKSYDGSIRYILIQSIGIVIGFGVMLLISKFDYEYYSDFAIVIYIVCILMLVAVLGFGTGFESTGSKSWIRFGPIGVQPSEFVKLGFILTFSKHLSRCDDVNSPKNIIFLSVHLLALVGLIMLQPDFGTTMVFICIFVGMMYLAGIEKKYIFGAIIALVILIPLAWFFFLKTYQKERILVFLNPESDPLGAGYHVIQSKIAIGSGGIFGKGLFRGTQTQLDILPVKHTDFIFAVIGEELGLIGAVLCLGLLFALVLRCIHISLKAKDKFGKYIAVGVAFMFMAHIFENIGMCVGLMPVTGIPLPFFSYGGSSVVTNLIAIGLVQNVYRNGKKMF